METENEATIVKKVMESPYKLSKHITSNDKYCEGFIITMVNGDRINFDIYKRINDQNNGFHFLVIKNDSDLQYASTLTTAYG